MTMRRNVMLACFVMTPRNINNYWIIYTKIWCLAFRYNFETWKRTIENTQGQSPLKVKKREAKRLQTLHRHAKTSGYKIYKIYAEPKRNLRIVSSGETEKDKIKKNFNMFSDWITWYCFIFHFCTLKIFPECVNWSAFSHGFLYAKYAHILAHIEQVNTDGWLHPLSIYNNAGAHQCTPPDTAGTTQRR